MRSRLAGRARGLPLAALAALVVIGLDRATKVWAERRLVAGPCRPGGRECIDLFFGGQLHLIYNQGAAFSTGTSLGPVFAIVAAVMTVVLLRLAATTDDRVRAFLLGLIAGGAVGNLIDRIARADRGPLTGGVIDFIDFHWWPVFNLADSAVVVGVIAFVLWSMRAAPAVAPAPAADDGPGDGAAPGGDPPAGDGAEVVAAGDDGTAGG